MTYQREPLAVRFGMAIPRALNNGFGYLSAVPGYKGVIAPLLAFGALAVGVETLYTAMPQTDWSLPREERKFIPKIGVEDNPQISRIVPFKGVAYTTARALLPAKFEQRIPTAATRTVWSDPIFWVVVGAAAAIQFQESKLFARQSYSKVKGDADAANKTTKMSVNPNALDVAKLKVARHNSYGLGEETKSGAMIILLYGVETVGFLVGFKGATSWLVSVCWGLYSVFGFETFHQRGDSTSPSRKHSLTPPGQQPRA